jgi:hypothetical protein
VDRWGDIPGWISAVATAFAAVGAAVASYFAYRLFEKEDQRDQRWIDGYRRAQASKVAVWGVLGDGISEDFDRQVCWRVRNSSDLPVFETSIFIYFHMTDEPTELEPRPAYRVWLDVLPPSDEAMGNAIPEVSDLLPIWLFAIDFRDATNQVWSRGIDGVLHQGPHVGPDQAAAFDFTNGWE